MNSAVWTASQKVLSCSRENKLSYVCFVEVLRRALCKRFQRFVLPGNQHFSRSETGSCGKLSCKGYGRYFLTVHRMFFFLILSGFRETAS